jgi:hypothetical protein
MQSKRLNNHCWPDFCLYRSFKIISHSHGTKHPTSLKSAFVCTPPPPLNNRLWGTIVPAGRRVHGFVFALPGYSSIRGSGVNGEAQTHGQRFLLFHFISIQSTTPSPPPARHIIISTCLSSELFTRSCLIALPDPSALNGAL